MATQEISSPDTLAFRLTDRIPASHSLLDAYRWLTPIVLRLGDTRTSKIGRPRSPFVGSACRRSSTRHHSGNAEPSAIEEQTLAATLYAVSARPECVLTSCPTEGICFPLSQVSPVVLEASSQWDVGAVSGSSHAGYGTVRTTARLFAGLRVGHWHPPPPGTPDSPEPTIRGCRYSRVL